MSAPRALAVLTFSGLLAPACGLSTHGITESNGAGGSAGGPSSSSTGAAACCEAVPTGWTLVHGKQVDALAKPGTCADSSTATIYYAGPAGAPTCSACQCASVQGALCAPPEISCWYNPGDCSGGPDVKEVTGSGMCQQLGGLPGLGNGGGSCKLTAPGALVDPGSCMISGGGVMLSAMWSGAISVCPASPTAAKCATGEVCVPTGGADGPVCITRPGNDTCPFGWAKATSAFAGGVDSRMCTSCTCQLTCSGSYIVYDDTGCGDNNKVTINSSTCTPVPDIFDYSQGSLEAQPTTAVVSGCTPAQPMGQVDAVGPQKICCR